MKRLVLLPVIIAVFVGLAIQGSLAQAPATQSKMDTAAAKAAGGNATERITVPLRFDRYYTYEQVGEALRALRDAYPQLATLDGTTGGAK